MTARVSCSSPSGPHMWPEVRIIAGIEASTMTSEGTCRLVMPRSESTIAIAGPSARPGVDGRLDRLAVGQRRRPRRAGAPRPSFGRDARGGELLAVLLEERREERLHRVAEDDRVGDLHHRGLEVHREQHALGLGPGDLLGEEAAQGGDVHEGAVDDLARRGPCSAVLEHGLGAVGARRARCAACRRPRARPTARWSGSRRGPWSRRWSWTRWSTRPSGAGGPWRSSSPTRARGGRSCPRAAPG